MRKSMSGDPDMNPELQPKILVVDDVPKNVQLLATLLSRESYQISAAMNGARAIEMAEKDPPDLILLDVMMPGMNGYEVCQALKRAPRTQSIPIIFLTAKSGEEAIVEGLEAGAVDYLGKPFRAAELLARVRTHLALKLALDRERRMREELEKALASVKLLSGLLPICAQCKKIRDDRGYWSQVEDYFQAHSEVEFSHGICPECARELYPELFAHRSEKDENRPSLS